jgi:hypothetical protein
VFKLNYNVINTPFPGGKCPEGALLEVDGLYEFDLRASYSQPESNSLAALTLRESSDHYALLVVQISPRWRVIESACGLQWILQYRRGGKGDNRWEGKSFCTTKSGLLSALKIKNVGEIGRSAMTKLNQLPDRFAKHR